MAFATSLAQCANESNATENINGILNSLLICFLSSCNKDLCFFKYNLTRKKTPNQIIIHRKTEVFVVKTHAKSA
ncbi:MAG: hypothetical protein ACPHY8_03415 [Patescibacteria group bacterium]